MAFTADAFSFNDEFLFCENLPIKDLQKELRETNVFPPSPIFVYSKAQLLANISAYMEGIRTLPVPAFLNYAMKANSVPAILEIIRHAGCNVTLVSGMELQMASSLGFKPDMMMFNGNGKQDWERKMAIETGCLMNIDSRTDLQQTINLCKEMKKTARVLLRVNLNIDPKVHAYINTGVSATKFGLRSDEIESCAKLLADCPYTSLVGLHSHLGSTIDDVSVFRYMQNRMVSNVPID